MMPKYDIDDVQRLKSRLHMSEQKFYGFYVNKQAFDFLTGDEVKATVGELLNDGKDFNKDSEDLDRMYAEQLFDEVHGREFAEYIAAHSKNLGDESEFEHTDDPFVETAARAFADDVFARAGEMFEDIKEEYESILENVGTVINGFRSGEIPFEESNVYHIVAATGLAAELDLSGSLAEIASEFRTVELPANASFYTSPEYMSTVTEFASAMAIDIVSDSKRAEFYPEVTVPGSLEEAAAILHYIEEAPKWTNDGGLGSVSTNYASDPDIRTMIFCDYTDNAIKHMLGAYDSEKNVSLESYEAGALAHAFKGDAMPPEGSAFVAKHARKEAPEFGHRAVIPLLDVISENAKSGKVTLDNLKELTASRDLASAFNADLKRYLGVMHPEVARIHVMQSSYGPETSAKTLLALMDGTAAGKAALASMKESVNAQVPESSKALGVFRKTLYPDNPAPQGPAVR